ncbi:hypothetical protein NQZ68_004304 [Dissostichus eleginoides]|nr:hypothetical protein NQZ68_004304 [Dissostichus eleginoides]
MDTLWYEVKQHFSGDSLPYLVQNGAYFLPLNQPKLAFPAVSVGELGQTMEKQDGHQNRDCECKAISSSVAPLPHPHLISSIPKQKLLLWEKCSATYVSVWSPNLLASSFFGRQYVCIHGRALQLQPESMRDD